jgi:HAD superfamily hydrolase (TIGR01509 family)
MSVIKGIFFDASGVLYQRASPTESFALDFLKREGFSVQPSAQDLDRQHLMHHQASQGQVSHEGYWDAFLAMRGVENPDKRKAMITQILDFSNSVLPVAGGREALLGLKARGYVIGIVTDTMYPLEWKMRRLARAEVADLIDVVACSTVLGVHKPDPAMYLDAIRQAHLTPSESAFVGHSTVELEGARQAGMKTVAVNYDASAKADYYAANLKDLLNVPIFKSTTSNIA